MKAVVYTRYGPPGVLRLADVERPVPGRGEVLAEVPDALRYMGEGNAKGKVIVTVG